MKKISKCLAIAPTLVLLITCFMPEIEISNSEWLVPGSTHRVIFGSSDARNIRDDIGLTMIIDSFDANTVDFSLHLQDNTGKHITSTDYSLQYDQTMLINNIEKLIFTENGQGQFSKDDLLLSYNKGFVIADMGLITDLMYKNLRYDNDFLLVIEGCIWLCKDCVSCYIKYLYERIDFNKQLFYEHIEHLDNNETRLVVAVHDSAGTFFNMSLMGNQGNQPIQGIQELNLVVQQIELIDLNGNKKTIMSTERSFNILSVAKSDPVILSDISVEPGKYQEMRLILKDENTIKVNDIVYPIKVPSGTSSGLKLKGDFEIPEGLLFTLYIELDTARSVSWNRGQGYMLHPVLNISSGPNVIGTFRGDILLHDFIDTGETIVQLFDCSTARIKLSILPNYTIYAKHFYHSVKRELQFSDIKLHTSSLGMQEIEKLIGDIPNQIILPIKQWSLTEIIAIDTNGITGTLYRVDEYDFSPGITFTEITLHIDYPDASKSGNYVLTEVQFLDNYMPPITIVDTLKGRRKTQRVKFLNDSPHGSHIRISVTSYLFDSIDNLNTVLGFVANQPALLMAGAIFAETTDNPWQPPPVFTLLSGIENQEFTIRFPNRLNIRMNHGNFTNNNPVVSWDPYPGANGYFVLVTVRDKLSNVAANRNLLVPAFYQHTMNTSSTINSHRISFTPIDTFYSIIPPAITHGDFIRIEVYALDHSGFLDSVNKTGALFMDSLTVVR